MCRNSIRLPDVYDPSTIKTYFQVLKEFDKKKLHVYLHNICVFVKFHEKMIFFVVYVKKRKFVL
jgi:hypothetical protein